MFDAFYDLTRFRFMHHELKNSGLLRQYRNATLIKKTACFYGDNFNVYIDTSDGVNEDLQIQEYCGRAKRIIFDANGKRFLYLKSAYSTKWSQNIKNLIESNGGKVHPFFKWSFNDNFYKSTLNKRDDIISAYNDQEKIYDIGIFFAEKSYKYPKPSESDELISWSDHKTFGIPGSSSNTGNYENYSRKNMIDILKSSNFKILHTNLPYEDYIRSSFQCKVIINPPGVGEYTSRMVDQTYLGNCIVLRKNSYDNGHTWKSHIPEIDFKSDHWEHDIKHIIDNHQKYQKMSKAYYENFWTPPVIVNYIKSKIGEYL
jgi:hypothetical protein